MNRLVVSLTIFGILSVAVGMLTSGDDQDVDWAIAGGLFAVALAGEGFRLWLRRSRAKSRESSGI
ncbi:hypothetical protein AB0F43_27780 [Kribbella sp. NPDC023972]|uniref:hypothetical protein n=1 Tax=Kribbella sp. NPDC023972 TaxID=3154795 RepID=UPI0033CCE6FC